MKKLLIAVLILTFSLMPLIEARAGTTGHRTTSGQSPAQPEAQAQQTPSPEAAAVPAAPFVSDEIVAFSSGGLSLQVRRDTDTVDLGSQNLPENAYGEFENFLAQLPNLKTVNMYSASVTRAHMRELYEMFPDVFFGWTITINCNNPSHPERTPHRCRTDITAFSTLHNNKCSLHSSEELSVLRYCKNLMALDIGHNDLTDLSFLYDLPKLKVLIVGINRNLTDITPIGSLKDLEYLELFSNNVSDISPLANCTHLVDLNITYNSISDLTPLMGLTSLRRLFVFSCNNRWGKGQVPGSTIAQLRNALPACTVDNYTGGAIEAWRTHPRYDTIYEMFWGTEYIPFTTLE